MLFNVAPATPKNRRNGRGITVGSNEMWARSTRATKLTAAPWSMHLHRSHAPRFAAPAFGQTDSKRRCAADPACINYRRRPAQAWQDILQTGRAILVYHQGWSGAATGMLFTIFQHSILRTRPASRGTTAICLLRTAAAGCIAVRRRPEPLRCAPALHVCAVLPGRHARARPTWTWTGSEGPQGRIWSTSVGEYCQLPSWTRRDPELLARPAREVHPRADLRNG